MSKTDQNGLLETLQFPRQGELCKRSVHNTYRCENLCLKICLSLMNDRNEVLPSCFELFNVDNISNFLTCVLRGSY